MKLWMELTEAELDDKIAASYLRDFRTVADNDRRISKFALHTAARAKGTEYPTETDRAEAVGEAVKGAFTRYLSPAQREDPLGRLLDKFLSHIGDADLGFHYLEKERERHAPSTDTERLIDTDEWEVVSTLHGEDCPECMRCAESGAILARVRGSAEGGQVIDHRGEDGELVVDHQAVVRRNRSGDDS